MGGDDFNDAFEEVFGPLRAMRASLQAPADTRDRFHVNTRLRAQLRRAESTGAAVVLLGLPYGSWSERDDSREWLCRTAIDLGALTATTDVGTFVTKAWSVDE
jgi:hypothetical protein